MFPRTKVATNHGLYYEAILWKQSVFNIICFQQTILEIFIQEIVQLIQLAMYSIYDLSLIDKIAFLI